MLGTEDLVDLREALRRADFKVATQQLLAVQHLLLRLAADGALPASRAALAPLIGPVLCTSAAEQAQFARQYAAWLAQRFPGEAPAPPPPAPPEPTPRRWTVWLWSGVVLLALALVAWQVAPYLPICRGCGTKESGPASQANPPVVDGPASSSNDTQKDKPFIDAPGLVPVTSIDLSDSFPEVTLSDRLSLPRLALALAPLLLFALWLVYWLARRPALRRIASRTPPQLREVHVPAAARVLLPSLPLRRLAQELRRRRAVASRELQVEPTIAATLARGGLFTPVRGARAEPDYLVLVDRAGLSDHQARVAGEVVAELARSDVLIERHDFDREATWVRPRDALARPDGKARPAEAVALAELHERLAEHRVLVFGDGAGCFDPFSGEPLPWTQTLAAWALPVLLTPVPAARWGRREWALQRLGIQVLPLDATGLTVLMGLAAGLGAPPAPAEPPGAAPLASHERLPRRWLERDAPDAAAIERLLADLHRELGARGFAWLAACAAYPEVHWGITLRLGVALVPAPREFEALLPRLARLVWFREAYLPDWLRERLLAELAPEDDRLARRTLRALLEAVAREGADVPLRIALGAPPAEPSWWRRVWRRLRARNAAQRARDLLRSAPPDSPLRDHVFLRFLSGTGTRRIDLRAPGALLSTLRTLPSWRPLAVGLAAFVLAGVAALVWPPLSTGGVTQVAGPVRTVADGPARFAVSLQARFGAPDSPSAVTASSWQFGAAASAPGAAASMPAGAQALADGWWRRRVVGRSGWQETVPGSGRVLVERAGGLELRAVDGTSIALTGSTAVLPDARLATAYSADGRRFAQLQGAMLSVWDLGAGTVMMGELLTNKQVAALELSDDGSRLALGTRDGVTQVWATDDPKRPSVRIEGAVERLRFSPDGRTLAVVTRGRVQLHALTGGELQFRFDIAGDLRVTFSPDGRWLACWGPDIPATLWDLSSGAASPALTLSDRLVGLRYSPDGRWIAGLGNDGRVGLWNAATGAQVGERLEAFGPQGCCEASLAFSADGSLLAGAAGSQLALWRVPTPGEPAGSGPRSRALLIGNDYRRTSTPLQAPVRDIRAIGQVLAERYGFEVTRVEDGSQVAVLAALDRLVAEAAAGDKVLVMFSGHGTQADKGRSFSFMATPAGPDFGDRDAVTGAAIARRLAALKSRELLIVGDTQYVHLLAEESAEVPPTRAILGRELLASYDKTLAFEAPEGSAFALALEAALRAAGTGLTARQLTDDVARRMAAADRSKTGQQPALRRLPGLGDSGGEFTLPAPQAASAPAAAASAPTAATSLIPASALNGADPPDLSAFGTRVLAVGDGWFAGVAPSGSTLLRQLMPGSSMAIVNASRAGDSANALNDAQAAALLGGRLARYWDGVLASYGLEPLIEALRNAKQPLLGRGTPTRNGGTRYLDAKAWDAVDQRLRNDLQVLLKQRDAGPSRGVPLLLHTYDYPTPRPAGAGLGAGPRLLPALQQAGVPDAALAAVARELIDALAQSLERIAADTARFPNLRLIDTRGTLAPAEVGTSGASGDWASELQPTPAGYAKLAKRWLPELTRLDTVLKKSRA